MPKYFHLETQNFPIVYYENDDGFNGAEIANQIRNALLKRGYSSRGILEEDWGWWIGLKDSDNIGVYCLEDYVIANLGKATRFSWRKLRRVQSDTFDKLNQDLTEIFEHDPDIKLLSVTDEF